MNAPPDLRPLQFSQPPAPELPTEGESDFKVAEYASMVRRHWKMVAAVAVTAVIAALIQFWMTPKEYMAKALVQIERRTLSSPLVNNPNLWLDLYNPEFYPTQYKLLESRGLAERVVRSLELVNDASYNPGAAMTRSGEAKKPTAEEDEAMVGRLADSLRGGLSVEPVRNTQLVGLVYRTRKAPAEAARIANAFAESFIDMGIEDRFATAGKASSFLGAQIETLKQEIQDKETQLQAFSRSSDILTLDPSSNVVLRRLEALNTDYINAKKERIEKESRYREMLATPKETVADSLSQGVVSEMRSDQLKLERQYETQLKTFKPEWPAMVSLKAQIEKGQQHLNGVIEEMVAKARGSANAEYQTTLRQERALEGELSRVKGEAQDQSSSAVEFNNLKVEVETRRQLLDELLRRQSETEVTARLQDTRDSNIKIIDHALVPRGPFRPSLRSNLTYGLFLGMLFGIGCALLIEFLDRTLKTPEEVERRLMLPTLAVIPDVEEGGKLYGYGYGARTEKAAAAAGVRPRTQPDAPGSWLEKKRKRAGAEARSSIELVPHEQPRTPIAEVYRSLRTALLLSSAEELRVIAVTSAGSGEGKTTTASNLAVVMAQLGRQVLVVDADLRKPRLHQVFQVSNRLGLVNHLTGATEAEGVFLPTEVPNLWITPSGPIPPNPSELLSSDRMREWTRMVRGKFDFVIFDTPPVLAVTDATIVGVMVDGLVLTLRAGKVTRDEARACRDRLRLADLRILGVVLNRHRAAGFLGKRYRYYEAYGQPEREPKADSAA
jgi:succinoglycan biosynthesis transport protein ExoP